MSSKQSFVSNKIIQPPLLYPPQEMQSKLDKMLTDFGSVQWVMTTESTNIDLYTYARNNSIPASKPWLLGAHQQNNGKGRSGRKWQNKNGAHLMFSCAFDVYLAPNLLPSISIICGTAACEALRNLLHEPYKKALSLKWPNDIWWQQQKLAGILVEVTKGQPNKNKNHHTVIVGIGINLNDADHLSNSLNREIADWSQIIEANACTQNINAQHIAYAIAKSWYDEIAILNNMGIVNLRSKFSNVDALYGNQINILDNNEIINSGIASGVNELGQLLITNDDGQHTVNVGEVSVRPNQA